MLYFRYKIWLAKGETLPTDTLYIHYKDTKYN